MGHHNENTDVDGLDKVADILQDESDSKYARETNKDVSFSTMFRLLSGFVFVAATLAIATSSLSSKDVIVNTMLLSGSTSASTRILATRSFGAKESRASPSNARPSPPHGANRFSGAKHRASPSNAHPSPPLSMTTRSFAAKQSRASPSNAHPTTPPSRAASVSSIQSRLEPSNQIIFAPTFRFPQSPPVYYQYSNCPPEVECGSGICGRVGIADQNLVCCDQWSGTVIPIEINSAYELFCEKSLPVGAPCIDSYEGDHSCQFKICSRGVCAKKRTGTVGDVCSLEASRDCPSGCGKATITSTSYNCCSGFEIYAYNGTSFDYYCNSDLGLDEVCFDNYQCASNICAAGKCVESLLSTGSTCSMKDECESYACGLPSLSATDKVCCSAQHGTYEFVDENQTTQSYCYYDTATGQACVADDVCRSGICLKDSLDLPGVCSDSRLRGGSVCVQNSHCKDKVCGYSAFGPPAMNQTKICCNEGRAFNALFAPLYQLEVYCAGIIPEGQPCDSAYGGDILCSTFRCVQDVCSADGLPNGAECDHSSDCNKKSNCAYDSVDVISRKKVCCAATQTIFAGGYFTEYCAGSIPSGETCDIMGLRRALTGNIQGGGGEDELRTQEDDIQTASRALLSRTPKLIPGKRVHKPPPLRPSPPSRFSSAPNTYAPNILDLSYPTAPVSFPHSYPVSFPHSYPVSFPHSYPVSSPIIPAAPVSYPHSYPISAPHSYPSFFPEGYNQASALCESGMCVRGVCSDNGLAANETCDFGGECESSYCALPVYDINAPNMVCCMGIARFVCDIFGCNFYCERSVPIGGACPKDEVDLEGYRVCQSGICVDGICREDLTGDGEQCTTANECTSGACGYDLADAATRKLICCPSGYSIQLYDNFDYSQYCTRSVPDGGPCLPGPKYDLNFGDARKVCQSGICIDGLCAPSLLPDKAPCSSDSVCDSGTCAFNSFDYTKREKVCCNRKCSAPLFDGFEYENYCVGIQDIGEPCTAWSNAGQRDDVHPELCTTGICINEVCGTELVGVNETCTVITDCAGGSCGYSSFDMSEKICCENGSRSIFDGICSHDDFCLAVIPDGASCVYRGVPRPAFCQSSYCTDGLCDSSPVGFLPSPPPAFFTPPPFVIEAPINFPFVEPTIPPQISQPINSEPTTNPVSPSGNLPVALPTASPTITMNGAPPKDDVSMDPTPARTSFPTRPPTTRPSPGTPTAPPELIPVEAPEDLSALECRDAVDPFTFFEYTLNERKTCAWLKNNTDFIPSLCVEYRAPYYLCPDTCGRCQTINPLGRGKVGFKDITVNIDGAKVLPCWDSLVFTFHVDAQYDKQTCLFLDDLPEYKDEACKEGNLAYYACPKLCGRC